MKQKSLTPATLARLAVARRRRPSAARTRRPSGTTTPPVARPTLTAKHAMTFAKILSAGVPPLHAIAYFSPAYAAQCKLAERRAWLTAWASSPLVLAAVTSLNGGEWHELSPDDRLQLAMDKHDAELAYFLYRHNFADTQDDLVLAKMKTAREAIRDRLRSEEASGRDKQFADALRDILEGKESLKPPQLQMGENLPIERFQS